MPAQSSKEGAQQTSPGESSCGFEPTQPSISSLAIFQNAAQQAFNCARATWVTFRWSEKQKGQENHKWRGSIIKLKADIATFSTHITG